MAQPTTRSRRPSLDDNGTDALEASKIPAKLGPREIASGESNLVVIDRLAADRGYRISEQLQGEKIESRVSMDRSVLKQVLYSRGKVTCDRRRFE